MKIVRHLPVLPEGFADPKLPKGTFSHSQYNLYKRCPKAYEFSYVLGIKNPPNGAMLRGTAAHAGAEAAHLYIKNHSKIPELEEIKATVSDTFDSEKDDVIKWDDDSSAGQTKDEALAGYTKYHRDALPNVKPIEAEKGFAKVVGTVPMTGYIDLIDAPKPGQLVVADMKTGATWSQTDINLDTQFTLYSAVTGISDVRVDNISYLKAGPKFSQKTATRGPMDFRNYVEDLEEVAHDVKEGRFPKTAIDSWQCSERWCGYWSSCRGRLL